LEEASEEDAMPALASPAACSTTPKSECAASISCSGEDGSNSAAMSQIETIFDELELLLPRLSGHDLVASGHKLPTDCHNMGAGQDCTWYVRSEPFCFDYDRQWWSEIPAQYAARMTGPCKRFPIVRAPIILIDPPHTGCEALVEDDDEGWEASAVAGEDDEDEYEDVDDRPLVGKIAVVMRGGCSFVQKVLHMQVMSLLN
jgi:hypothetical protein